MKTSRIGIGRKSAVFPTIFMATVALLAAGFIVFAAVPADATDDEITVTTYEELKRALDAGHNVMLGTYTTLEGDVQFIKSGQYMCLDSGAKYKGTVTYDQNFIVFGGKDGSETMVGDYIVAETTCYIIAGEPLEIKGGFKGEDVNEKRFIKITGGSVKAIGGITGIRLEVLNDSTFTIESEENYYSIDANSLLDICGKVIVNGGVFSSGSVDVCATGTFDVKGALINYASMNIDSEGSIIIDGTMESMKYGSGSAPTITNKGTLINNGTISIKDGTFDVSAGSTQNNKVLTINGTIIGSDVNPVKNRSMIELNGESNNLVIENIEDGAVVNIISFLCKTMTISNSIGDADTSDSTIRIEAEHFALEGLKIVSKTSDSARYNDMSGKVGVTDQKSPLDHDVDRVFIECASVYADGYISIDGELSLPKGVTLNVGYYSSRTIFTIGGTFATDAGTITAEVYKDGSKTDIESVTGLDKTGGLRLMNTEVTIAGKYTAKGISLSSDGGNVLNCASYQIDGMSNYASLGRAVDECSKSGRDCLIWVLYEADIDDNMLITSNITLNAMKGITVKGGKILTVSGTLTLISENEVDGIARSSVMDNIVINGGGSVTVQNGEKLIAKEIKVFGSLSSSGSVEAERIFVGTSDEILRPYPAILGAVTSVSGQISATEYWVVAAGSDVSGVKLEGCKSTSYVVEDVPYITLYAESSTYIGIVTATDREEARWIGWYAKGGSMTDVSDDLVGDYSAVCAMFEDDIVTEGNGITAKDCLLIAVLAIIAIILVARVMRS